MTDLQTILQAIDELPAEAIQQVKRQVEKREEILAFKPKRRTTEGIENVIVELEAAVAEFRQGLSIEEWDEAARIMNQEYIEPDDPSLFDWNDEVSESKK